LGDRSLSDVRRPQLSAPAPINPSHNLAAFDSGAPALDTWLQRRALSNENRFSRTFVVTEENRVVGYYCLLAGSVQRALAPPRMRRNAPDPIPVIVIGRLAVTRSHAGRGLGRDLLADAFRRAALASRTLGVAAVLVQAKDERARAFYLGAAEFLEYPAESRTLFLPVETLAEAVERS
jgi:GNAT superfamily N-acetyltransferase